jgi:CubicO group peptidase (beta-lactamase class C family)
LAAVYTYRNRDGLTRFPDGEVRTEGAALHYTADYPYKAPKLMFAGGGGLCSTAIDYARFCQMLLNHGQLGEVRILSKKSVELMTTDHLGKIDPEHGFGLGFGIDGVKTPLNELGSPGQYQWGGFFYTAFTIDPKEDMFVIFMGQLFPTGGLNLDRKIYPLACQAIIE